MGIRASLSRLAVAARVVAARVVAARVALRAPRAALGRASHAHAAAWLAVAWLFGSLFGAQGSASAQAALLDGLGGDAGYGERALASSDDGSSDLVDLTAEFPAGLRFYGHVYGGLYVNTNGNLSFVGPQPSYTPDPFPLARTGRPVIAPWWADVDTRDRSLAPSTRNTVYYDVSPGRFVATWLDVGYFRRHVDRLDAFQVILTDASEYGIAGAFDVELRYARCEWTTGDFSGGSGGLGGTAAQAGFDAGDGVNYQVLPGSFSDAVVDLCTTSNVGEPGVWRYQVRPSGFTVCGNRVRELGEACDDGNVDNGDGCNAWCALESDVGASCDGPFACRTGFCVDGFCCASSCDGACEACGEAGSEGLCVAVTGLPRGDRASCEGGACGAQCDGVTRDACRYPLGVACDDGVFCTASDACDGAGGCHGVARSCDDGASCTLDACDEDLASCVHTPRATGTRCDDGASCTTGDACDALGACVGEAVVCEDDALACTLASCDETTGACASRVTEGCVIDGACVPAGPRAGDPCLVCDPLVAIDRYVALADGAACGEPSCVDGMGTAAPSCVAGTCTPSVAMPCEAGSCADERLCLGVDGGTSEPDAGLDADAGGLADAGLALDADAGLALDADAGPALDGGPADGGTTVGDVDAGLGGAPGGCGCRAGSPDRDASAPAALQALVGALAALVWRRRRSTRGGAQPARAGRP